MSKDIREIINKINNIQKNDIIYKEIENEDGVDIIAYINNIEIGSISLNILHDAYEYEFQDEFDEDEFDEIFPKSEIIKISHIEIGDSYKNRGIGTNLMLKAIKLMYGKGYTEFYLNASPMGFSGLRINDLVEFYEKFGFRVIKNQGHNMLMALNK